MKPILTLVAVLALAVPNIVAQTNNPPDPPKPAATDQAGMPPFYVITQGTDPGAPAMVRRSASGAAVARVSPPAGNGSGEGALLDIILGIVGAVAGGWLFNRFGMAGVTGLNLYSLLVAIVGAALLLIVYHAVTRGSR